VAAATQNIPGLVGVVNFAGGLRHLDENGSGNWNPADEGYLLSTYNNYGKKTKTPMLWIYTQNDSYFPPPLSQKMVEAFIAGGGKATLKLLPSFKNDGHPFFPSSSTIPVWLPLVEEFFADNNIPYRQ
jgi:dienelactone hydrolase